MSGKHNLTDRLYTMYDVYAGVSSRYEHMKQGNVFTRNIGLLPCKLEKLRLMRDIRQAYLRFDSFPRLSGDTSLVVSLTSFPARMQGLHLVIKSLLMQTVKPGKIMLYLSADEFPRREEDLPTTLCALVGNGLSVRFVDGNLRSHKKYYYAFKDFPDSTVITVDDDILYPQYTIERLVSLSRCYCNAVCANIIRVIGMDGDTFMPYRKWGKYNIGTESCSMLNAAIGCGGVLYPPRWYDESLFDTEKSMSLCPYADDLWLKAHQLVRHVAVAFPGEYFPKPIELPGTARSALQRHNNGKRNMNDIQWERVDREFGLAGIVKAGIGGNPLNDK